MLKLRGVKYFYGETRLSFPDWELAELHHALILGNSGSGKTTLLHLIGGLMKPSEGTLVMNGEDLAKKSGSELDTFRGMNIGIVFQRSHLVKSLTVRENLFLAQTLGGRKKEVKRTEEILQGLGILNLKNRKIHQLSQGQAQRVSIARAVINSPKVVLADEPTASLDDENCKKVIELLKSQAERTGSSLIVATHDHRVKNEFENQLSL